MAICGATRFQHPAQLRRASVASSPSSCLSESGSSHCPSDNDSSHNGGPSLPQWRLASTIPNLVDAGARSLSLRLGDQDQLKPPLITQSYCFIQEAFSRFSRKDFIKSTKTASYAAASTTLTRNSRYNHSPTLSQAYIYQAHLQRTRRLNHTVNSTISGSTTNSSLSPSLLQSHCYLYGINYSITRLTQPSATTLSYLEHIKPSQAPQSCSTLLYYVRLQVLYSIYLSINLPVTEANNTSFVPIQAPLSSQTTPLSSRLTQLH